MSIPNHYRFVEDERRSNIGGASQERDNGKVPKQSKRLKEEVTCQELIWGDDKKVTELIEREKREEPKWQSTEILNH